MNQGVIVTGNYFVLIRCAQHHPADQIALFLTVSVVFAVSFCKTKNFSRFEKRSAES